MNVGAFEKTVGTGTSTVAVNFTNEGTVSATTGKLKFVDDVAGVSATGSWSGGGSGSIVLAEGTFPIGEAVGLEDVNVEEEATVERTAAPVSVLAPSITGSAEAGHALEADIGSWAGAEPLTDSYRWLRCNTGGTSCGQIAGATEATYVLGPEDVGATVRLTVTASNSYGRAIETTAASAAVAAPPAPLNEVLPALTGAAQDGKGLTASTGTWSSLVPVSYSYQWERCNASGEECSEVEGATNSKYDLSEGDIGATLRVAVTATNAGGATKNSSAVSSVVEAEPPASWNHRRSLVFRLCTTS